MQDSKIYPCLLALCLLLNGCFDPTALQPSVTHGDEASVIEEEQSAGDVASELSGSAPAESDSPPERPSDQSVDLQWLADTDPLNDEEFAAVWPRITGTWSAVRIDTLIIENGTVSRANSEAMLPQFITMIIDDSEWQTIRRRRGQSETEAVDVADLQQRVRDRNVVLDGDELYFLMIEADLNGGSGTQKHYTVCSRE